VDGALSDRQNWGGRPLAAELAKDYTVYLYDRRGRGESTDTRPYAVEREIEDIEALIDEAGGPVRLYGASSGAVLALKAAAKLGPARVTKLAVYEPPFNSDDKDSTEEFTRYKQRMAELLEAGKRHEAVVFFLSGMLPAEVIEGMRSSPDWPVMEAVAHTLAYDNAVLGDGAVPVEDAKAVRAPVLILEGGESPAFLHAAAEDLARVLPQAQRKILEGQTHAAIPQVLAPVLAAFFAP
jgi:pimeloyl-ACP methyl ester carboxylesterase